MRQLLSFLLIAFAFAASAAETWRWKDANGVVHYSDRPVPGAERVYVAPPPKSGEATAAPRSNPPQADNAQAPATVPYARCVVTSPANDTVFNLVHNVVVTLMIEPWLQPGHRFQVLLNGQVYTDWPTGQASHTLTNLYRGSYALSVRVLDAAGRPLCSGEATTFHVRQPSLLMPGRQKPARP